jgi:phosphoadenosine phosphosulfate reductase
MSSVLEQKPRAQSPSLREESGYASAASSQDSLPEVYFSKPHLKFLNAQLQKLEPQGEWKSFMMSVHQLTV